MNLNKHLEFIQPTAYNKPIHIVGVGAIGSRVAEVLVRLGFDDLHIYDFDIVEDVNVTNQLYTYPDLGMKKIDAMKRHLMDINPALKLTLHERYVDQILSGAVFLSVDSIDTRRKIVTDNMSNMGIDLFLDIRMRLTDAQAYAAVWNTRNSKQILLNTMAFTDAEDLTPVSVCGTSLSVAPTILTIVSMQVFNFIKFIKEGKVNQVMFVDLMEMSLNAFSYKTP